jgi:hypothetical protein
LRNEKFDIFNTDQKESSLHETFELIKEVIGSSDMKNFSYLAEYISSYDGYGTAGL